MSYISTRVWLIEVFLHLPRILDSCHQRHCSERRRDCEDWLIVWGVNIINIYERRTAFNALTADLGRHPLNSVTRYRLTHFGVKRTWENWTPHTCKLGYEGFPLAPSTKWIVVAFRRKLGDWTKASIVTYWANKDLAGIGVSSATAMRSKMRTKLSNLIMTNSTCNQFLFKAC